MPWRHILAGIAYFEKGTGGEEIVEVVVVVEGNPTKLKT